MLQATKKRFKILIKLLPIIAIITSFLILYYVDAASFEKTWKGRTFYIFFSWLISLEIVLNWEKLQTDRVQRLKSFRSATLVIAFLMPIIYVIVANFYGLNEIIASVAENAGIFWASVIPLSTEYLVFTVLFVFIILVEYGVGGLKRFSVPTFFLGLIGIIYTIDNLYPQGSFTPFQIIVPTTTTLAASVLSFMGYNASVNLSGSMPRLEVKGSTGSFKASIGWPCAGVESLLIYTVTILLFLRNTPISWRQTFIYFVIGAVITYLINILRIATIFIIGINGGNVSAFHDYYGSLYSITWIISYPLIILGSQALWEKIRHRKNKHA